MGSSPSHHFKISYETTDSGVYPKIKYDTSTKYYDNAFQVVQQSDIKCRIATEKACSEIVQTRTTLTNINGDWCITSDNTDFKVIIFFAPYRGTYVSWVPIFELLVLRAKTKK